MTTIYSYCTLDEILEDSEGKPGMSESVARRFILAASDYITREIGAFQPTFETRKVRGTGKAHLYVPPLLRVTGSIINGDDTLTATDYLLMASAERNGRCWADGPYLRIDADPDSGTLSSWDTEPDGVQIPGAWGLYERTEQACKVDTKQVVSAETLVVKNGSRVSVGMLLLIDSEVEYVSGYGDPTAGATTLGANLDASSEVITVASGVALKVGEIIKIDFEKMKVLDIQTNSVYVARGWDRTKKAAHTSGASIGVYRTYKVTRAVNGTTAAEHAADTWSYAYKVPRDVNYLARQIATLMWQKSGTAYAGRSGNAESGETFYIHDFPREPIENVRRNYYLPPAR